MNTCTGWPELFIASLLRRYDTRVCVPGPAPRLFKFQPVHVSGNACSSKRAIQKKNVMQPRAECLKRAPTLILHHWYKRSLSDCNPRTTLMFCERKPSAVISGVLQASVLGLLLFLIYTDGLSGIQLSSGSIVLC